MRDRSMTVDRSDPRGPKSRKIFSTSRILRLHAPKKTDRDKRESLYYQDTPWATKRRPRPSESFCLEKPPKEYSTPPQAQGYCRVSILGIPKTRKLAPTLTSPDGSRCTKRSRPTQGRGLRLARPQGHGLRLARPLGFVLRLVRPQGRGFRLVRRGPIPPPTTPGPSVWAWVKTLTPRKRLSHL